MKILILLNVAGVVRSLFNTFRFEEGRIKGRNEDVLKKIQHYCLPTVSHSKILNTFIVFKIT